MASRTAATRTSEGFPITVTLREASPLETAGPDQQKEEGKQSAGRHGNPVTAGVVPRISGRRRTEKKKAARPIGPRRSPEAKKRYFGCAEVLASILPTWTHVAQVLPSLSDVLTCTGSPSFGTPWSLVVSFQ